MDMLLPADLRSRLKRLALVTRHAAGHRGVGWHRSTSRGAGLEFAQYRSYEPGDDLRQIDWKLYGRSDKFFVRESERESPVAVWVLIDASGSMRQADRARPDLTRLDAARLLTLCIAELAIQQGDRFGFATLGGAAPVVLAAGTGARQRDALRLALQAVTAEGGPPEPQALAPLWNRIRARDLVIVLSDFFDEGTAALAERLAAAGRETLAIRLLTVEERDFPFTDGHRFRDPETGAELLGDGRALRDAYLARFTEAEAALRARFEAAGIRHAVLTLDHPIDTPLRELFARGAA